MVFVERHLLEISRDLIRPVWKSPNNFYTFFTPSR